MRGANIFSSACFGFLIGILTASFFVIQVELIVVFVIFFATLSISFFKKARLRNSCLAFCFACFGMLIFYSAASDILNASDHLIEREIEFLAKVLEVDERFDRRVILVVEARDKGVLERRTRITLYKERREFKVGDIVVAKGKLKVPENFNDFDYKGYLAKEGVSYVMISPSVEATSERDADIRSFLFDVRISLKEGLYRVLPPDSAAFYSAMLLGSKGGIRGEDLRDAGLSHIVAISGLHIAILFGICLFALYSLSINRSRAIWIAVFIIALYIVMIGAPASAIRAGLMVFVLALASLFGRPSVPWRALLFAATIMAAANPLIVRYDVGFQLSFAAVLGIITILRGRDNLFTAIPDNFGARSLVLVSVAAYLATAPLVILHFGRVAEWGIVANLFVVPLLPFILVAGLIAALVGVLGLPTALAAPAFVLSSYVLTIAGWFS